MVGGRHCCCLLQRLALLLLAPPLLLRCLLPFILAGIAAGCPPLALLLVDITPLIINATAAGAAQPLRARERVAVPLWTLAAAGAG